MVSQWNTLSFGNKERQKVSAHGMRTAYKIPSYGAPHAGLCLVVRLPHLLLLGPPWGLALSTEAGA